MKTGRPGYHIPSAETVSHDVKQVFVMVRQRIAKMLQVGIRRATLGLFLLTSNFRNILVL